MLTGPFWWMEIESVEKQKRLAGEKVVHMYNCPHAYTASIAAVELSCASVAAT